MIVSSQKVLTRPLRHRMATSFETLGYAGKCGLVIQGKDVAFLNKLSYVLVDISGRSILEQLAFSVCTRMWVQTSLATGVSWGCDRLILLRVFHTSVACLVFASAVFSMLALVFLQDSKNLDDILKSKWARIQLILEAVTWGLQFVVVLRCTILTASRVIAVIPQAENQQRRSLLAKAVGPMLLAAIMYAQRSVWLLLVTVGPLRLRYESLVWWTGFMWVPTIVVISSLLYSVRKREVGGATDEIRQPLLLPRPPDEAFLAFSYHRLGLDVDDSFSFCRSPITHIAAPQIGFESTGAEAITSTTTTNTEQTQ